VEEPPEEVDTEGIMARMLRILKPGESVLKVGLWVGFCSAGLWVCVLGSWLGVPVGHDEAGSLSLLYLKHDALHPNPRP
jgi:hypothetical protein